ncbi:MAG: glycosyltransferase family 2 protein, partial [Candidatus Marinimicrobia bacterium]|nr:glycosyltransferase family 2 protein [Candidatus Neomarinimicrobiota bacterium]
MTQSNIIVSVIIPHWNGIDVLSECLDSLKKTNFDSFEIIVSENASSDGSQAWVKENHPDVILVENDKNYGYAGGCNRGANLAKGKYLLFLNNDTIQDPNWLQPLVDRLESDSSIAAVQPKILNYYKRDVFDYAGGSGGFMDIFCFPFARGRLFLNQEKDTGQYDEAQSCFWASGTAMMVRKNIFESAGKFDETFFAHMEEIDLCWRFQAMGFKIWAEPKSIVYHKNAVSLPMHSHRKYYLNHRNSLLMLFGNFSIPLAF